MNGESTTIRLVAVGSTNPVKVAAARAIAAQAFPGAVVQAVDVASGVADQPMSDDEMVTGARNRAEAARLALDADLGLGMEGGVQRSDWGCLLTGWAAVVDRQGCVSVGSGGSLALPPALAKALEQGEELGPAMDKLSGQHDTRRGPGSVGILTKGLVSREEAFRVAVAYALTQFLHPKWYPDLCEAK